MIDPTIDRIDAVLERLRIPLAIIGGLWFAATCAAYAGFIRLPEFHILTGMPALLASVAYNAIYWGFVWPRFERRRKERASADNATTPNV